MNYTKIKKLNRDDPASIKAFAETFIDKCLKDIIPTTEAQSVREAEVVYKKRRKGYFGELVEEKVFELTRNALSVPDFTRAGVELKTTPLKKHGKKTFAAKERLVFSMIDYIDVVNESWETSSFIKKNRLLLILFYLFDKELSLLDYKFKIVRLLDLISDIPSEDILQIQKDWENIIAKIRKGDAHLLSEGDTFYLGACTKAANSSKRRPQAVLGAPPAKPRAFSLKQTYLNYLIQDSLIAKPKAFPIRKADEKNKTIDDIIEERFRPFIGKTDDYIKGNFNLSFTKKPKNYTRLLIDPILGAKGRKIEELEKANVKLKVINLEKSGTLREGISFPAFKYCEIIHEEWEESDLYKLLTSQKFLFVVFRKRKDGLIELEKYAFWNFPLNDLPEAKKVWEKAISSIKDNKLEDLPKISESYAVHVRPHALNKNDKIATPGGGMEVRKSFWLNAKYIKDQINA